MSVNPIKETNPSLDINNNNAPLQRVIYKDIATSILSQLDNLDDLAHAAQVSRVFALASKEPKVLGSIAKNMGFQGLDEKECGFSREQQVQIVFKRIILPYIIQNKENIKKTRKQLAELCGPDGLIENARKEYQRLKEIVAKDTGIVTIVPLPNTDPAVVRDLHEAIVRYSRFVDLRSSLVGDDYDGTDETIYSKSILGMLLKDKKRNLFSIHVWQLSDALKAEKKTQK